MTRRFKWPRPAAGGLSRAAGYGRDAGSASTITIPHPHDSDNWMLTYSVPAALQLWRASDDRALDFHTGLLYVSVFIPHLDGCALHADELPTIGPKVAP